MKTQFLKMQSEHSALILFCGIIAAILGAVMAILSHYPPPAYILAAAAFGIAAGGIITARRESRFIVSAFQAEIDKADEFAERHIQPAAYNDGNAVDDDYPHEDPFAEPAVFNYPSP